MEGSKRPATTRPPKSAPYAQGAWASAFAPRAAGERRYWLIKSEPDVFSFDALQAAPGATTHWDGVRNTGARNFLRDGMKTGDLVLYYHSNADPPSIVGIAEVVREGYPDPSAFDPASEYYDADSDPAHPAWFMVDVRAVAPLARPVSLQTIKDHASLRTMALVRVGRLSVVPVEPHEWDAVLALSGTRLDDDQRMPPASAANGRGQARGRR